MKIRMHVHDRTLTGTLIDSEAARDFASLLPLTLTLRDYASTEKISDLPRRLSTTDAPDGYKPSAGDITYYSPWGNLAVFYRDFDYADGLVHLGTLDQVEGSTQRAALNVRIELLQPSEHRTRARERRGSRRDLGSRRVSN